MQRQEPDNEYLVDAIKNANPAKFPDFDVVAQNLNEQSARLTGHQWRQRGPHLVCISCPHEHTHYIGMEKLLAGFDEKGAPILKSRW